VDISITYDDRIDFATSVGFMFKKEIRVGKLYVLLPKNIQQAILAHELCHCIEFHLEQRWLCLLCPFLYPMLCRWQELRADRFASNVGLGAPLLQFFKIARRTEKESWFYPSFNERIKNLEQYG
jgi:hypothetical protein